MFPFNIITWVKIGAIATALAFSYWKGYSGEHEKFLKFKVEIEAVGEAQKKLNASLIEKHELITEGVQDEYEARIAAIRNYYSDRMQSNSGSSNVSSVSVTTTRVDESAGNTVPAGQCAEVTQQLVSLQKWVEKQIEK
jgi:hypothetical protein